MLPLPVMVAVNAPSLAIGTSVPVLMLKMFLVISNPVIAPVVFGVSISVPTLSAPAVQLLNVLPWKVTPLIPLSTAGTSAGTPDPDVL
jgi:hypothetical protein